MQFNSFGCGLDAISTEQTADILTRAGKLYTLIKIDEGKNNGAVKIRIRSLLAAIKMRKNNPEAVSDAPHTEIARPNVTETKGRVLLCPPLSNYHFQFLGAAFENAGIKLEVLPEGTRETVELGCATSTTTSATPR